jgi:hypothetical protein
MGSSSAIVGKYHHLRSSLPPPPPPPPPPPLPSPLPFPVHTYAGLPTYIYLKAAQMLAYSRHLSLAAGASARARKHSTHMYAVRPTLFYEIGGRRVRVDKYHGVRTNAKQFYIA